MANYFLNDDGSLSKKNKKKKGNSYILQEDGRLQLQQEKMTSTKKKEKKDTWFSKGAFEDGYQIGDITKSVSSTVLDVAKGVGKGAFRLGEGVTDAVSYGISGVAKAIGNDEVAEKWNKKAQNDVTEKIFEKDNSFNAMLNKNSLIGGTGDGVTEGLGYVGAMLLTGGLGKAIGLGAKGITALTSGLTFTSSTGSGMSEAYKGGATDKEATTYGIISGIAEAGTELIFGGLGKTIKATGLSHGLSSADDMLAKKVSDLFTSKIAKTISEVGIKAGAEGLEEVASGIIQAVGQKVTYMDEKELSQLIEDQNLLDQFITGAVVSGIAQVPSAKRSIEAGRDYITGYTANEQKVLDNEVGKRTSEIQKQRAVDNRVNELLEQAEKTFGEVTEERKKAIRERVQSNLDNGKLDYTTAELSDKEIAKIEEQVKSDLSKGFIDIGTIESTLSSEKTAKIQELQQQLETTKKDTDKQAIQQQINELQTAKDTELRELLKNDSYLQESYRQEHLKKQEFTYEAQDTDSDITKELVESAKNAEMNDTRKMHDLFDWVNKVSNDKGTKYGFVNNTQLEEMGYYDDLKDTGAGTIGGLVRVEKDGTTKVLINVDSDKALNTIIGHETTHLLEGTNEYKLLQQAVKDYATTKGEYNTRIKAIEKLYKGTNANIESEVTADLVGDYLFTDEQFINNLSTKQPNVFTKIYDYIKHAYKMATAGSKEARQLEQLKYRFDQAYKQNVQAVSETQYSLVRATDEQMSKAEELKKQNLSPEEIYLETGAYEGADGRWRREIDDSKSKIVLENAKRIEVGDTYKLKEVLKHPELYKAYPKLKNIEVKFVDNEYGYSGMFNPNTDTIELDVSLINKYEKSKSDMEKVITQIKENDANMLFLYSKEELEILEKQYKKELKEFKPALYQKQLKSTLMHEIQHWVQKQHGFARGSNVEVNKEITKRYREHLGELSRELQGYYDEIGTGDWIDQNIKRVQNGEITMDQFFKEQEDFKFNSKHGERIKELLEDRESYKRRFEIYERSPQDLYENTAGEIEAREVQKRLDYTKEQRQSEMPFVKDENTVYAETYLNRKYGIAPKYSLSVNTDNQGRTLSKEQATYFKDSKVRDEKGNLLAVYHGTRGDFNVFETKRTGQNYEGDYSSLGKGSYFTSDINVAKDFGESSVNEGDLNIKETYLDIKNPFYADDMAKNDSKILKEISEKYDIKEDDLYSGYNLVRLLRNKGVDSTEVLQKYGYDGIIAEDEFVVFNSNQVKNVDNANPTESKDIRYSLSEETAPTGDYNVYGKDVKVQKETKIDNKVQEVAPVQQELDLQEIEQVAPVQDAEIEEIVPNKIQDAPVQVRVQSTTPTQEEVENLYDIQKNKSGSEYAMAFYDLQKKYGYTKLYKALNEYKSTGKVTNPTAEDSFAPVSQEVVEQQRQDSINSLVTEEAPLDSALTTGEVDMLEAYEEFVSQNGIEALSTEEQKAYNELKQRQEFNTIPEEIEDGSVVKSPLENRSLDEVGNRKVKAYQYEHPEVRPFFQAEADNMLGELDNTIKGEKSFNDQLYYDTNGEQGWFGTTRQTSEAIAYLKDNYGYSYEQIRKGLNAIIEDNGLENNAVSKRLEILIDERLRTGYKDFLMGYEIPANQEYINLLKANDFTDYYTNLANTLTDDDIQLAPEPQKQTVEQPKTEVKQITPTIEKVAQNENTELSDNVKQRSWVKTSTESEVVKDKLSIEDLENTTYEVKSNKKTLEIANEKLGRYGYEDSITYFNSKLMDKKVTTEDIVLGERLIQEALNKGDTKTASELIENVAILGTELGQKIQALSIIQRLTPEGQLRVLQKVVNRGKTKGDVAFENVEITQEMKDKILSARKPDGTFEQLVLNEVVEQVKQEIADQMKTTLGEKVNAWRYLSMLGNPKTHIRNLISNIAMKGTSAVKNAMARTIEDIAPIKDRTKTWKRATKEINEYADRTTAEVKEILNGESSFSEDTSLKNKRQMFQNKILEKIYNFNSDLLTKEDWWFKKSTFKKSFAEYLTANGIRTKDDIKNNYKIVEKAKLYAMEQAQIATFSQYSYLANKINEIENKNIASKVIVGSAMPFKKTPINIAKAGLSYSPLGFAKVLAHDIPQVKKGNMEASQLIDNMAQATTGSALLLVGYMLAQAGFLNGGGEDDKEGKYDSQLGEMKYSIKIGDTSFSLSWLSPVAMPLFIGANAHELLVEKEEWNSDVVIETLAQTLDPLSEMSFLSGLTQVLSSYETGSMQQIAGMVESVAQNYVGQFVPTLSSQVAGTLDDTKRTTTATKSDGNKFIDTTINKLKYKIPGLRETLEPSLDIWGNEVKQAETIGERAIDNFIAPYSKKKDITTHVDTELKSIFKETGENSVLPSTPSSSLNYKDGKYNMTSKEFTEFKKQYGQTAYEMLEELFTTNTYAESDSNEKANLISKVYEYARDVSKKDYFDKHEVEYTNTTEDNIPVYKEKSIKNAIEYDMTPEEYSYFEENPSKYKTIRAITDYETYKTYSKDIYDIKGDKDENGKTVNNSRKNKVFDYINNLNLGFEQKVILAKMEYPSYNEYNYELIDYLNNNQNISYTDMEDILIELGFEVDAKGNINW